ncbi:MAG TPA: glycosyltransferase family 1 protein [Candidatus Saccharimonadaceae bacterium]|jgi:glycosyltransferase involved in cell wall biosynthesis|nr:glycosyltransferase family 1 protein [Candidatus Saccharimonadaceae bacterium]
MSPAAIVYDLRYATTRFPGVGSYAVELARALLAQRPELPWRVLVPERADRFDLSFVRSEQRVTAGQPGLGAAQFRVGGVLRRLGAVLYHTPFVARAWGAPCPNLVTIHDVIPLEHPASMGRLRRGAYRELVRDALRANRVITDSAVSLASLRREFPQARAPIRVLHPGAREWPESEPWPAWERPALLAVGINKPHKNLETLVRALARISRERRPLLVCAGPHDARYPGVHDIAVRHGIVDDVRVLGMVEERRLAGLYRSATLFAFPTRIEGFGLPLLEALSLGIPSIASDIPILREVAGDAALFVDSEDDAAWADAIARLLDDGAARVALTARGLARAGQFRYAATASEIFEEYVAMVPSLAGPRPTGEVGEPARGRP